MSKSTLWGMNSKFEGISIDEFSNSWLFSPIVWDILFEKYTPENTFSRFGKINYIAAASFDKTIFNKLNEKVNWCDSTSDRICWEMTNQQIFYTKDKKIISDSILQFLKDNERYNDKVLTKEHIIERFTEVSKSILEIDEIEYPYFIFKNTSVDDNVEHWFKKYNEEIEEYESVDLSKCTEWVSEFVVIKDNIISETINNLKFFNNVK